MKPCVIPLLASLLVSTVAMPASAEFFLSVNIAPPMLPIYVQPRLPGEGYVWTPGYWAYDEGDYFWVPGTWVRPPRVGLLWTPGYWAWNLNAYSFRPGYWGSEVGYYGGVNYGYGYGGHGYEGGRWEHNRFMYNRAVNNISTSNVRNTYNRTVINNTTINRVSYTGGTGGLNTRASAEEQRFERRQHVAATTEQLSHEKTARAKPELRRAVNKGRPAIAATVKPAAFDGPGVIPAKDAYLKPAVARHTQRNERNSTAETPKTAEPATPARYTPQVSEADRGASAQQQGRNHQPTAQQPHQRDQHQQPAAQQPHQRDQHQQPTTQQPHQRDQHQQPTAQQPHQRDQHQQPAAQQPHQRDQHQQTVQQQTAGPQSQGAPDRGGKSKSDQEARRAAKAAADEKPAKQTE